MVRLFSVYYPARTLALLAIETLVVWASFLGSTTVRHGQDPMRVLRYQGGFYRIGVVAAVCLLCIYYYDLYDSFVLKNSREVFTRLVRMLGTMCLVMAGIYLAFPQIRIGTQIFLAATFLTGILLATCRKVFMLVNQSSALVQRIAVLGSGPQAARILQAVETRSELGLRLVGYLGVEENGRSELGELRCLGSLDDSKEILARNRIGQIVIAMEERRGRLPVDLLLEAKTRGILILNGADFYERITGKVLLTSLRPSWLLFSQGFRLSVGMRFYKRAASIVLSLLALVASLPWMVLIAIVVRLDSDGPIIYCQERIGEGGRIFTMYKFRTMREEADVNDRHAPAAENDSRVTRAGRWLRHSRLDELPQLFNILRGDMHFVGPRPFVPSEELELIPKIPYYRDRHSVKPGATGWAQINRGYCRTIEDNIEKLAFDLFYIKNISVGLDLLICLRTIKTLLLGRGGR